MISLRNLTHLNVTKSLKTQTCHTRHISSLERNNFLVINDEIKYAQNKPVVALESTIITHGLPYPVNLETALEVENVVRQQNVNKNN